MTRSMSVMRPISLTGLFALLALAACTYEDRGYDYGDGEYYGASGYRDNYGYGYRPDEDRYRYQRRFGGDYCNSHRCERADH
jgi:hypothetical protein